MKSFLFFLALVFLTACSPPAEQGQQSELERWQETANRVTIIRDNWGIPHIYGDTDADVVFGLLYAQAEDDFNRIEVNFLNAMGRLAEAEGEKEIYRDLRMKLFIDPEVLKQQYVASPDWLKKLMNAWADGLNYYLHTHPEIKSRVLERFEPWMALSFSEGSIGGDIESVSLNSLENFYGERLSDRLGVETEDLTSEPQGSNGFAIAPNNSATGNALLLINPHTSFYFRAEVHMVSEEGLNAYGRVTWGQFFVYQGFSDKAGWMHTSSHADVIDEYLETVVEQEDGYYYKYGDELRPFKATTLNLPYKDGDTLATKEVTVFHNHHGPVIREADGKWVTVRLMNEPMKALSQSFLRTKANGHSEYYESGRTKTNSSNNTVYADAQGNIAYYHGNFHPRRDLSYDYTKPVDGSNPATDWQGLHPLEEQIILLNPENGWLMNTNNWPFSAAGEFSPKKEDYPVYMSNNRENHRGIHAIRVLEDKKDFTLESLLEAAYDSYLPAFAELIPTLVEAYDNAADANPLKAGVSDQIEVLRGWDYRYSETSVPTSLAVFWGEELMRQSMPESRRLGIYIYDYMAQETSVDQKLAALVAASNKLVANFSSWKTAWGEINRFQRLTGDIVQPFDDDQPSYPVGFTSSRWGSLAAYGQRTFNDTRKIYGTRGNSFVAVVEFGDKVRAKAVSAGGQSGDPSSPHFADQAELYARGQLRDVYYYKEDVLRNAEETYQPGQRK